MGVVWLFNFWDWTTSAFTNLKHSFLKLTSHASCCEKPTYGGAMRRRTHFQLSSQPRANTTCQPCEWTIVDVLVQSSLQMSTAPADAMKKKNYLLKPSQPTESWKILNGGCCFKGPCFGGKLLLSNQSILLLFCNIYKRQCSVEVL